MRHAAKNQHHDMLACSKNHFSRIEISFFNLVFFFQHFEKLIFFFFMNVFEGRKRSDCHSKVKVENRSASSTKVKQVQPKELLITTALISKYSLLNATWPQESKGPTHQWVWKQVIAVLMVKTSEVRSRTKNPAFSKDLRQQNPTKG